VYDENICGSDGGEVGGRTTIAARPVAFHQNERVEAPVVHQFAGVILAFDLCLRTVETRGQEHRFYLIRNAGLLASPESPVWERERCDAVAPRRFAEGDF